MQQISMKSTLLIGLSIIIAGCAGNLPGATFNDALASSADAQSERARRRAKKQDQRYSGEHLAESTRAILKPWEKQILRDSSESRFVLLLSIDGKETELPSRNQISMTSYFISPGEHTIKVALFAVVIGEKKQFINPEPMMFKAKTGHTYITKAYLRDLKEGDVGTQINLSFWIEDEKTGDVVSGKRWTPEIGQGAKVVPDFQMEEQEP